MTFRSRHPLACTAALALALTSASFARADTLPPNDCNESSKGQACNTAGLAFNSPGTCTEEICSQIAAGDASVPSGDAGMFLCVFCVAPRDAGAVNALDATARDAAGDGGTHGSSSSGCANSPRSPRGSAGWLAGLAVSLLIARRRRRR